MWKLRICMICVAMGLLVIGYVITVPGGSDNFSDIQVLGFGCMLGIVAIIGILFTITFMCSLEFKDLRAKITKLEEQTEKR